VYRLLAGWTEERIEREAYRFKSVATTYGKTHLKDDAGRDLYLNELDIDDEEIFTRLSIINTNGRDHYFLDEIGKITFGVKTQKAWGRRYYWSSHKQGDVDITGQVINKRNQFGLMIVKSDIDLK
jgi:hypothetical protein